VENLLSSAIECT